MLAYLFDRRSWVLYWLLIAGIGLLLFTAGYLIGVNQNLPREATASQATPEIVTQLEQTGLGATGATLSDLPADASAGSDSSSSDSASTDDGATAGASGSDDTSTDSETTASGSGSGASSGTTASDSSSSGTTSSGTTSSGTGTTGTGTTGTTGTGGTSSSGDTSSATTSSEGTTLYSIQVAALILEERVDQLVSDLQAAGYLPYTVEVFDEDGRRLTGVRIGRYESVGEAEQAATAYQRERGGEKPVIREILVQ